MYRGFVSEIDHSTIIACCAVKWSIQVIAAVYARAWTRNKLMEYVCKAGQNVLPSPPKKIKIGGKQMRLNCWILPALATLCTNILSYQAHRRFQIQCLGKEQDG